MPDTFTLGDHTFTNQPQTNPSQANPFDRPDPKRILGAPPPTLFEGIARDATEDSPAAELILDGSFCGHGEPTYTVFDIIIDNQDVLECAIFEDDQDDDQSDDPDTESDAGFIAVRAPGSDQWHVIWTMDWADRAQTLEGCEAPELDAEAIAVCEEGQCRGRISIGFEYPADCDSRDCVTWMTLYFRSEDNTEGGCMVDAELA